MAVRGIVFDMDGVLCDSEPFIRAAAKQMFLNVIRLRSMMQLLCPLSAWAKIGSLAGQQRSRA